MRTVIGWTAALFASALLGAVVYETVLSKPVLEPDATAYVETTTRNPTPGPTVYRTEVRKVVEPTPTVTSSMRCWYRLRRPPSLPPARTEPGERTQPADPVPHPTTGPRRRNRPRTARTQSVTTPRTRGSTRTRRTRSTRAEKAEDSHDD